MSSQEDMNVVRRNLAVGEEEEDGANFAQAPSPAPSNQQGAVKWVTSALVGVVFGIALEKGRVFVPVNIQEQMLFDKFLMVKMFLSAVATGLVGLSALAMIPATNSLYVKVDTKYSSKFGTRGVLTSLLGGSLIGAGMTISGACPGMVLAQFGAGTTNSAATLLGGLTGTLVYGLLDSTLIPLLKPSKPYRLYSLHRYLDTPYFMLAMPLAAMLATVVFGLELAVPWTSELDTPNLTDVGCFSLKAWPPYVAGMLIGGLQVPLTVFAGDTLGGSSSYGAVVAQFMRGPLRDVCPFLNKMKTGLGWQVLMVGGIIGGAYMSSTASGTWGTTPGVGAGQAFLGGAIMLFGSRLAGGCTSGHGVSGTALLNLLSFVVAPAMFGGGMATAFFMRSQGFM